MPQFITRMNESAKQYWLHGIIVCVRNNDALVKVNYEKNLVSIFINGDLKSGRSLLDEIREHLTVLNDKIKGIQPKILVPLPENHEITVSYNLLLQSERAGKENVFIENIGDRPVKPLLDGIISEKERTKEIIDTFQKEVEIIQLKRKQDKIQTLKDEISSLQENLKMKDRKHQLLQESATSYANRWFNVYWALIFFVVLIGVAIGVKNWDSFGEPLAWGSEVIIGLLIASGLWYYSPNKLFEKMKKSKMGELVIYGEFDEESYFHEKTKLQHLENQLSDLQN